MNSTEDTENIERYFQVFCPENLPPVPAVIQKYNQVLEYNKKCSIFDEEFDLEDDDDCRTENSIVDKNDPFFQDDNIIRVVSGRGRGGRNTYQKPGTKISSDDLEITESIRKIAPIGYRNEVTENAIKKYQMEHYFKEDKYSDSVPSSSISSSSHISDCNDKMSDNNEGNHSLVVPSQVKSEISSSKSSDNESSDYFSSRDQLTISGSSSSSNNSLIRNEETIVDVSNGDVASPMPLCEILKRNREQYKRFHRANILKRENKENYQLADIDLESRLKIEEILEEDKKNFYVTKKNSKEEGIWTFKNKPARIKPDIHSKSDFPPLS
ncbi:hypothetical protein ABEB36_008196 [Hypothenemus hampei]|uniref:Uncharacterized protein n=1 Tax=Hypothenemus hampei TaxID=57062 RepID=A0ABD1ELN4_HYPHA